MYQHPFFYVLLENSNFVMVNVSNIADYHVAQFFLFFRLFWFETNFNGLEDSLSNKFVSSYRNPSTGIRLEHVYNNTKKIILFCITTIIIIIIAIINSITARQSDHVSPSNLSPLSYPMPAHDILRGSVAGHWIL